MLEDGRQFLRELLDFTQIEEEPRKISEELNITVREFGPLIVSIDTEGRNLFEEQKVIYNQRKEAAKQAIYPQVKFIK